MKTALIAVLLMFASLGFAQDRPRVYVTDKPMDQASLLATRNAAVANIQRGDDPRTTEIQADIVKICPHVTVTSQIERADFVLVFRRENGKRSAMFAFGGLSGLALSALAKVDGASLFDANGDMITATKQRTVEKSVREICGSIPQTVSHQVQAQIQSAPAPAPVQQVQPAVAPEPPVPAAAPLVVVTPAVYHPAEAAVVASVPETSLGEAARHNKQHGACLKLAVDNPSITCQ
jgi:hypothetical protein